MKAMITALITNVKNPTKTIKFEKILEKLDVRVFSVTDST